MKNYGVLKASAKDYKRDQDNTPHSELLLEAAGVRYRAAINVRSSRGPTHRRLVEYVILDDIHHVLLESARRLPMGWNDLRDGQDDGAAIDYVRSNLFRPTEMRALIHDQPGPNNDLFERVESLLERAIADQEAIVYAFGESWGPEEGQRDAYFGFEPGNGVHNIHMNQGGSDDGDAKFQDGALLVEFPAARRTTGLFIKFQNQVWHTDEQDANPIPDAPQVPPITIPPDGPIDPWPILPVDSPYHLARIVGALIDPRDHDPGSESVAILNTSPNPLDLTGWVILDAQDRGERLSGTLAVGEARTLRLSGRGAQLGNRGGTITLLEGRGLKVDGVSYARAEIPRGRALAFR